MERRLYHGLLGLMLVALLWGGFHVYTTGIHGFSGGIRFNRFVFLMVMMGSIPVTMLLMLPLRMILCGQLTGIFWIKHPSKTVEHETADPVGLVAQKARQRLDGLGFVVTGEEGTDTERRLLLGKGKKEKVTGFIDHAFTGELLARQESGRSQVVTRLVFEDTIVVESGEQERLAALARYISGASDELRVPVLPFTMVCGVTIAVLNLGLWPVASVRPWLAPFELSIALAAVGLILFGGYPIVSKRAENHGLLLGLLGLAAAVLPVVSG